MFFFWSILFILPTEKGKRKNTPSLLYIAHENKTLFECLWKPQGKQQQQQQQSFPRWNHVLASDDLVCVVDPCSGSALGHLPGWTSVPKSIDDGKFIWVGNGDGDGDGGGANHVSSSPNANDVCWWGRERDGLATRRGTESVCGTHER
jgi:hypothetical protein